MTLTDVAGRERTGIQRRRPDSNWWKYSGGEDTNPAHERNRTRVLRARRAIQSRDRTQIPPQTSSRRGFLMASFVAAGYGIDDITLGFDMEGSGSIKRLNTLPGSQTRRGKMLGEVVSWGKWAHLLGRSVAFWKADTNRLYVQAKMAAEGELCAPSELGGAVSALLGRMAVVGLVSYAKPWVTRLDVAVDSDCDAADGKLLLDTLEAARLPNGWRTTSSGVPRSTVYFRARTTERVYARAYCRNLKTKTGEPYGWIRLEVEERFDPRQCPLDMAEDPGFAAELWKRRYAVLSARITRRLRGRCKRWRWRNASGEGSSPTRKVNESGMFLEAQRLGLAAAYYPKGVYAARRREAGKLGYSANESGTESLDVEPAELLAPYVEAVGNGHPGHRP